MYYPQERALLGLVDWLDERIKATEHEAVLIDGDIVAYKFAVLNEDKHEGFEGAAEAVAFNMPRAVSEANAFIKSVVEATEAGTVLLVFSGDNNFRYKEYPEYKHNRKPEDKPKNLGAFKDELAKHWHSVKRDQLEADDVLGILATNDVLAGSVIVASIDKDLDQIEGWHYNWNKDVMYHVSPEAGNMFFWLQATAGDATDGYSGARRIGMKRAQSALDEHEEPFRAVYSTYIQQGHDFAYMLSQIRCARMLLSCDYDWENDKPIMWQPPYPTSSPHAMNLLDTVRHEHGSV
jgi:DNA polymerase-1